MDNLGSRGKWLLRWTE